MTQQPTQLAKSGQQQMATIKELLQRARPHMESVLPKHLTAERLIKVALVACSKDPKLLTCTQESLLGCIMLSAELGLEAGGPLGHFYMIPYRDNKRGVTVATPIVGYQGQIELVHRSGQLISIEAHVVHENDKHGLKFGRELELWHTPTLKGEPGDVLFAYAVAHLKDGGCQAVVMTKAEIEAVRSRARAKDSGPWVTDWEEMAKKTTIRRIFKMLPKSTEELRRLARAMDAEETGDLPDMSEALPEIAQPLEPEKSRTQSVREKVAEAAKAGAEPSAKEKMNAEAEARIAAGETGVVVVSEPEPGEDLEPGASRQD